MALNEKTVYIDRSIYLSMLRDIEPHNFAREVGGGIAGIEVAAAGAESRVVLGKSFSAGSGQDERQVILTWQDYSRSVAEAHNLLVNQGQDPSGIHLLGSWHTHPGRLIWPSPGDISTAEMLLRDYYKSVSAFLFIVFVKREGGLKGATASASLLRRGSHELEKQFIDIPEDVQSLFAPESIPIPTPTVVPPLAFY